MSTPSNSPDLRRRLRVVTSSLSPAAAQVVAVIERDPAAAAQRTVHQLADDAKTSPASVVRVARALGYDGYPQLRLALAAAQPAASEEPPLGADVTMEDDTATIITKLAALEIEQLRDTADLLDAGALSEIAAACAHARRIAIYGVGASGLAAADLAGKLNRLGLFAQAHSGIDAALPDAALLTPQDVAIGVSHSGASAGALRPLQLAATRGATTVAVTGLPKSQLAQAAQHVLTTAGREFGLRSAAMASRSGQLLAGDALFVRVAQLVPNARAALQRTYDSLR